MQITLNQEEIHQAVESYVRGQITIATNQEIDISFTAGRGENGLSATLNISPKKGKVIQGTRGSEADPAPAPTEEPRTRAASNPFGKPRSVDPVADLKNSLKETPAEEPAEDPSEEAPAADEPAGDAPDEDPEKTEEPDTDGAAEAPVEEKPVRTAKSIFSQKAS